MASDTPVQNYVCTRTGGFRAAGEDYSLGEPVPVADIPNGQNLVKWKMVALDNSPEGIKATQRAEAREAAAAEETETPAERDSRILRELEEEAAPERMGDYGEETEEPPEGQRGADLTTEEEREVLAELHADAPEADPTRPLTPEIDEPASPERTPEEEADELRELEEAAAEERMGEQEEPDHVMPPGPHDPGQPANTSIAMPLPSEIDAAMGRAKLATPEPDATEAAREKAEELGVDLRTVTGTGENGRILVGDVEKAAIDEESEQTA